jgi:cyclopropane-fatty-acyl-phospholipid synthase
MPSSRRRHTRPGVDSISDVAPGTDSEAGFHYDFSNEFYSLWLDPTMTYSCAYFADGSESLEQAQLAKIDLALGKVGLSAGQRLLDVGCGWGAAAERAAVVYGARAVGITLSRQQYDYALTRRRPDRALDYRLEGWETYAEPCDRIVSFGAFEHFTTAKYPAFFGRCRELLPADGRLLLQTITVGKPSRSFELLRFAYFLYTELFGAAELPRPEQVLKPAREAGLELLHAETLRLHYVRTIEKWLERLEARRAEAIAATSADVFDKFVRYLEGSARYHRGGETNIYQFLFGVA